MYCVASARFLKDMQRDNKKTILVDIGHPGHVHLFRVAILAWKAAGHKVVVTIRDRGLVGQLLQSHGISYEIASSVKTTFWGLVYELLEHDWHVARLARQHRVDVLIGTSVCITHAGLILRKPSIVFNEDDKHYLQAWALLAYPIASAIVTPFVLTDEKTSRYIVHRSLHELAYLHPNQFTPDPGILDELGVAPGDRFFIVRFVALQAHHDFKHRGLGLEQRRRLLTFLEQHGRVFVSDEALPEGDRGRYKLPIHPSRIHHAMYFATALIGDSQTMAVESAVLGTHAVRCNTFVRECSIINEVEDRYGLIHSYHPQDFEQMLAQLGQLLARDGLIEDAKRRRERLMRDKGDLAVFIESLVPGYTGDASTRILPGTHEAAPTDVDVALRVLQWMRERAFKGIDPYLLDAKLNAVASGGLRRSLMRRVRSIFKPMHALIPQRVFAMAAPVQMPKVLGLSLSGIAGLSSQLEPHAYQDTIQEMLQLLRASRSPGCRHLAWGHPFSWGSAIRYTPHTPAIAVTALIAHGLMDVLESGRASGLEGDLASIARYILEENGHKDFGDSLCFYYAPANPDLTFNTSILAASFLLRLDAYRGTHEHSQVGEKALRFVLQGQNADGSWYYTDARGDTPLDKTIDGRHTGFILEHLARIARLIPPSHALSAGLRTALERGTNYYLERMMDGTAPRWAPDMTYPVDIKDVAQAIITLSELRLVDRARACLDFAYANFFNGTDAFWFKLHEGGSVNRTVFIRWSQAWMLKAIGAFVRAKQGHHEPV